MRVANIAMAPQGPLLMSLATMTTMTSKNRTLNRRRRSVVGHNPPFGSSFTNAANPHNAKSNIYKHCKTLINYHKKSESVKVHLNNCVAFRKVMNGMEDGERPEWYHRNKKGATQPMPVAKNVGSAFGVSSSLQSSIKQYALLAISKTQKAKFQKHMALHYYATGTSF